MKANLPESRNRNLPPPPAAGAPLHSRPIMPPPEEPRRGPTALRSFLVMLLIAGLLGSGIWFYIRGAESDVQVRNRLHAMLTAIGANLWEFGHSDALSADTEDTGKDLADLPRVITGVRNAVKNGHPEIRVIEGDVQSGRGTASHQILFVIEDRIRLIIRVWYERDTDRFKFIGETNPIVPSRRELEKKSRATTPGTTGLPPIPGGPLPGIAPPVTPDTPPPALPTPPAAAPAAEKVSEER